MLFYFIKINSIWRVVYYLFTIKYTNILVTAFKSVMQIKKKIQLGAGCRAGFELATFQFAFYPGNCGLPIC
jgi:hypothetical protein